MPLILSIISIVVITSALYLFNKILPFKVCPICAGVSLTWFLISIGIYNGILPAADWTMLLAMLMGGTVVGIAYQAEKTFRWAKENNVLSKTLIILVGLPLAYLAIENLALGTILIEAVLMIILIYFFFIKKRGSAPSHLNNGKTISDLEKQLEECC